MLLPFGIRPLLRDISVIRRHLGYLSLTAFLVVTLFNTLIYIAAHTSEATNLSLIAVSSPIFIILFAWLFLGERLTARKVAGLTAATAGVILLITEGEFFPPYGPHVFSRRCVDARGRGNLRSVQHSCSCQAGSAESHGFLRLHFHPWASLLSALGPVGTERRANHQFLANRNRSPSYTWELVHRSWLSLCWNEAIARIGPVRCAFVLLFFTCF